MQKLYWSVRKFFVLQDGATMVEYGLMVALIAVVSLAGVTLLGVSIANIFNQTAAAI